MRVQASPEGTGGALRASWPSWKTRPPPSGGPSLRNRPPYRVDRGLLGDAPGHRPAHDLAGEGACRGREIEPPFSRGHRQAMPPTQSLLRSPTEKARSTRYDRGSPRLALLPDAAFSGRALSGKPGLLHDAEHALLAHGDAAFSQFAVDAPVAVAALVPMEGLDDEPFERLSLYPGVGLLPGEDAR